MRRTIRWRFRARAPGNLRTARSPSSATTRTCCCRRCRPASGEAAGIELKAFVDHLDKLPDIDAILRGEEVLVPKEIDLQYAVAAALVGRAIRAKANGNANETYGRILDYARRFPQREMGVMLVSDMHRAIGAGSVRSAAVRVVGEVDRRRDVV